MKNDKTSTAGDVESQIAAIEATRAKYLTSLREAEQRESTKLHENVNKIRADRYIQACADVGVKTKGLNAQDARAKALKLCKKQNTAVPDAIKDEFRDLVFEVRRVLADGSIETAAQAEKRRKTEEKEFKKSIDALRTELSAAQKDKTESSSKKRKSSDDKDNESQATKRKSKSTSDETAPPAKKSKTNAKEFAPPTAAENWNASALTGDEARRNKFMRLLGAGKGGKAGASTTTGKTAADISRMENELEQQFDAGIRMKHEQGGKRRGLGA